MMKGFKKITLVDLTDEEEAAELLNYVNGSDIGVGKTLLGGTIVRLLRNQNSELKAGRLAVVQQTQQPDGDGDYPVWYIGENGQKTNGYANKNRIEIYTPRARPHSREVRSRTRSIDLGEQGIEQDLAKETEDGQCHE